jgi:sugar/nucleoside kinase (ribokinase family)
MTIGSATKDVFLYSKAFKLIRSEKFETGVGECVSLGSKIEIDKPILTTGGGGTNAAATFSSLGFNTAIITRLGDDSIANDVLAELENFNVNTSLIKHVKRGNTGYSVLLTAEGGERSVLVHRGVSAEFKTTDVPVSKLKTKWIYISSLGGNLALVIKIARAAKKKGIRVAYNPGSLELKQGALAFEPLLRNLSILNLNLEEAQMLARTKSRDIKTICKKIHTPELTLIITDGPNGAYAHNDHETLFARTRNIKAISRTGAGDAFGSGVVASLMKGLKLQDALCVGTINAESVIQSFGAKNGILKRWPKKSLLDQIRVRTIRQ